MSTFREAIQIAAVRRLIVGSAKLLSGHAIASLVGFVSFALCARELGVHDYGVLILISTGISVTDKLFNFQSWQALIKFGAGSWVQEQHVRMLGLLRVAVLLDLGTAVAACLIANLTIRIGASAFDWSQDVVHLATWYSTVLLFNLTGVPTAVLRLANRYDVLGTHAVIAALVRLGAVSLAALVGGGLLEFGYAWIGAEILGYALLFAFGVREIMSKGMLQARPDPVRVVLAEHRGLIRFLFVSNLQTSVRLASSEGDTMVVGAVLGASGAGLYNVVKKLSKLVSIVLSPLYQTVYPELTRAYVERSVTVFRALVLQSTKAMAVACLAGWVVFLVIGRHLLGVLGEEYEAAYYPVLVYLVGVGLSMISFSYQPAMLALGRAGQAFVIMLWTTSLYLGLLILLSRYGGVMGACVSYAIFYALWSGAMYRALNRGISAWAEPPPISWTPS